MGYLIGNDNPRQQVASRLELRTECGRVLFKGGDQSAWVRVICMHPAVGFKPVGWLRQPAYDNPEPKTIHDLRPQAAFLRIH